MPIYTFTVPASLSFDVSAETPEDAQLQAEKLCASSEIMSDYGTLKLQVWPAPWIVLASSNPKLVDTYEP